MTPAADVTFVSIANGAFRHRSWLIGSGASRFWKTPAPPRTAILPDPVGFHAKPPRGEKFLNEGFFHHVSPRVPSTV
jgi:hypothetical protein